MRRRDLLFVWAVLASAAACSGSAEAPGRQQRERGRLDPLQGLARIAHQRCALASDAS